MATALAFSGCGNGEDAGLQGYVAGRFLLVASPVAGYLDDLPVMRGDQVTSGQALFHLDLEPEKSACAEAAAKLAGSRATLEDLKTGARPEEIATLEHLQRAIEAASTYANLELARIAKLYETRVVSEEQLNLNQATQKFFLELVKVTGSFTSTQRLPARENRIHSAAEAAAAAAHALAQAAWSLEQKTRKAPRDAMVFDTLFLEGEWIPAGSPVVSLLPPGEIRVRFYAPQPVMEKCEVGRRVEILAGGKRIAGTIDFVSPEAVFAPPVIYSRESDAELVFLIEARPDPESQAALAPGQPARVFLSPP